MDFKRIMVGLDLTAVDQAVLQYASYMCGFFKAENIYFVHIEPNLDLDESFLKEYNVESLSTDEKVIEKMKDTVEYNFSYNGAELHFEVHEGKVDEKFLHWINIKNIDMVFMGRKDTPGDSGLIPTRLARRSRASICLVPKNAKSKLDKIFVGNDFSDHSKKAVELALSLKAANSGNTEVVAENVYFVPTGYYKTGKSYEEFADIMKSNAKKDFERFSRGIEGDFSGHYTLDDDRQPADKIYASAKNKGADMIIVGGKGRTLTSMVMIGSVAEQVISYNSDIPMIVLKDKKEEWGFWDALKSL